MQISNLAVCVLVVSLLVGLVLAPRKLIDAPALTLFRSFFPAWRFFEAIGPSPALSYRLIVADRAGPWIDALSSEPRGLSALVLNAHGNLQLACQSLVEQFDSDLETTPPAEVTQLVSYQLINNLVVARILASSSALAPPRYAFRITSPRHDTDAQSVSFMSDKLAL